MKEEIFLKKIEAFLINIVQPNINNMDENVKILQHTFNLFTKNKFFKVYIPFEYGGRPLSLLNKVYFEEIMGRWGGSLAFLQAQTATAAWIIKNSGNEQIKKTYLTAIANGETSIGNSVSHLRYKSKLIGEKTDTGFKLSGKINFISGWNIFNKILIGFNTLNNEEVFALISCKNTKKNKFQISDPIDVISMNSLHTVSVEFQNYEIKTKDIVIIWKKGYFMNCYRNFPPYAYPIGLASEALSLLIKNKSKIHTRKEFQKLENQLSNVRFKLGKIHATNTNDKIFSEIIKISWQCIQFSLLNFSSKGLLKNHCIQRIYRELPIWLIPRAYSEVIQKSFK